MKKICTLILVALSLAFTVLAFSQVCMAAEEFKPVTLKCGTNLPENSWYAEHHKWWANEVEKRTGGKVKIQMFWMESLFKIKDGLPAIQNRIGDLGWITSTYHPSNFPLYMMLDLNFNWNGSYVATQLAGIETAEKQPDLRAELEREKIVLVVPHAPGIGQIGTKKCFDSIKDLKGKTIRSVGGPSVPFFKNLGANPVFMAFSDVYEALDRGTISAMGQCPVMYSFTFKLYEVIKCLYIINSGTMVSAGIYMNLDVFKKLPKDVQEMFMKLRTEYAYRFGKALLDTESEMLREWQTKHGLTIKHPSAEDKEIILEAGRKANEDWIKQEESKGNKAAGKVWDYYLKALKKYGDEEAKKK
jgi:TRAP-type C4-dicarboxylate transport system substrate-binding protein